MYSTSEPWHGGPSACDSIELPDWLQKPLHALEVLYTMGEFIDLFEYFMRVLMCTCAQLCMCACVCVPVRARFDRRPFSGR